jgi:hypothetical protein
MKNFLYLFFCFFAVQIISCSSFGTIEVYPETTKLTIQNDSGVRLLNVKWNGINFGDIGLGDVSEMDVPDGESRVAFEVNGKEYLTYSKTKCEKYKRKRFTFIDATLIIYSDDDWIELKEALKYAN